MKSSFSSLRHHFGVGLRLYFRHPMAMAYGYLFPLIFLIAFWMLYRYDRVPLIRHVGELLTITVLGGACLGMPTTIVSERERGVWRRYRLTPVSTGTLVTSTLLTRYLLMLTAGLLQLGLARLLGMPFPEHVFALWVAFTFASFAFLGMGLVASTLADSVPAVQALGQCIFLPMLIIGGIAVQLESLPPWAQHVSAFFPGRYSVEAIEMAINGSGLTPARFSLLALTGIGLAGLLAGTRMFRWDAEQRFINRAGKGWIAVALGAWIVVGVAAEYSGHFIVLSRPPSAVVMNAPDATPATSAIAAPPAGAPTVPSPATPAGSSPNLTTPPSPARSGQPSSAPPAQPRPASLEAPPDFPEGPPTWQQVTMKNIDDELTFDGLPPDSSVYTPIAAWDAQPDVDAAEPFETFRAGFPNWAPAKVSDPVQRVRNLLLLIAVVDVRQLPIEPYAPLLVIDDMEQHNTKDELIKILYWIAIKPYGGDDSALRDLSSLGLQNGVGDVQEVRDRAALYGVKILGRLTGKRPGN